MRAVQLWHVSSYCSPVVVTCDVLTHLGWRWLFTCSGYVRCTHSPVVVTCDVLTHLGWKWWDRGLCDLELLLLYQASQLQPRHWPAPPDDSTTAQKKETLRCGKSRTCPDHPRTATPTKVVVWVASRSSQPCQVSSKPVQGSWLHARTSRRVKGFSLYLGPKELWYNRLELRHSCRDINACVSQLTTCSHCIDERFISNSDQSAEAIWRSRFKLVDIVGPTKYLKNF